MEDQVSSGWKTRAGRAEAFDSYMVLGIEYYLDGEPSCWHITSYPHKDPIHHFWVDQGKFYPVSMHMGLNGRSDKLIEIGAEIINLDDREKGAILTAIRRWENLYAPTQIPPHQNGES